MNPLVEYPNLFANGKFQVEHEGMVCRFVELDTNLKGSPILLYGGGEKFWVSGEDCLLISRPISDIRYKEWVGIIKRNMPKHTWGKSCQFRSYTINEIDNSIHIVWDNKTSSRYSRTYSFQNMPYWLFLEFLSIGVCPLQDAVTIDISEIQ